MELEGRIGTLLRNEWTLERLLGSGHVAAVYVGRHKAGRRDAIRILHPHVAREPEQRTRFEQEAQAASRFVHPGAVEIRDVGVTADGCPFFAMELLEGESLGARYDRSGPPATAEILRIAEDVLDVLAAAHAHGIIHRAIEPKNLFCLPDGRIKVLDFGAARVRQGLSPGTCMPPEQVKGAEIDGRADVFALGATMFRLIAKRPIHEAGSDAELVLKMATQPAPALASVAPGAPADVCSIVDRALAFDREERFPNAIAMRRAIRAVRKRAPSAAAPPVVDQEAPTTVMHAAHAMAPVAPKRTRLTALTQWTVTTMRERRLRWAALVFPLIAAGVLALVFYSVTRVDHEEANPDSTLQCGGPGPCVVSCAGKCKIVSQPGVPVLVHCTLGLECEVEGCPTQLQRCSPLLLACGTPCPG